MTYLNLTRGSVANWVADIYNNTLGTRLLSIMTGTQNVQLAQPLRIDGGQEVLVRILNYGTPGPYCTIGSKAAPYAINPHWLDPNSVKEYSRFTSLGGTSNYIVIYNSYGAVGAHARGYWAVYNDNAGAPGTIIQQGILDGTLWTNGWNWVALAPPLSLTTGTKYWLAVEGQPAGVGPYVWYGINVTNTMLYSLAVESLIFFNNPAGLSSWAGVEASVFLANDITTTHDDNIAEVRLNGFEI